MMRAVRPSPSLALALAVLTLALGACAGTRIPHLPLPATAFGGDRVVVLVPGITGSVLRDRESGEIAWGNAARLFFPRDRGHALALPIAAGAAPSRLVATEVIASLSLGPYRKEVYGPVFEAFRRHGFRVGSLGQAQDLPPLGDLFVTFPYDWRRDNLEAARSLVLGLEELAEIRGPEPLQVTLLCQSSGAHICRWAAKYGAAGLAEAAAGERKLPAGVEITDLLLVGTANGGSLRILRELHRGRLYLPWVGRRIAAETLFTFPSLAQDLPACSEDHFLDAAGEAVVVDLYDPAAWERHGWSIFAPRLARKLAAGKAPAGFGSPEERRAFLARALAEARRFHRLLAGDPPGYAPPRLHLIQSLATDTPRRALLEARADGSFRTSFSGDRRVDGKPHLAARATARGDGHATEESQLCLSPAEQAAIHGEPLYVEGGHFELILTPEALRRLLEVGLRRRGGSTAPPPPGGGIIHAVNGSYSRRE